MLCSVVSSGARALSAPYSVPLYSSFNVAVVARPTDIMTKRFERTLFSRILVGLAAAVDYLLAGSIEALET